jgi:putative peptidoglycan lipid II flippase
VNDKKNKSAALLVAAGIFLSRIFGLIRESVFAYFFGNSDAADAFKAALRIPNFLQNLFGEGVLSASFIPVYSKLLAQEKPEEAKALANAVAGLLSILSSIIVLLGILFAPFLVTIITPGFEGEKKELAIQLVRILFPGAGVLVLSAWCLGILNSHRKFFLSYCAPVFWNLAIILTLLVAGQQTDGNDLAIITAWGVLGGSALQFLVQLPTTIKLVETFRPSFNLKLASVRLVLKNFFPIVFGRGVVQVSAYLDALIASFLPSGALATLAYAQIIYLLPISLFGMSVSAAELPEMSKTLGTKEQINEAIKSKLQNGLRQIAFFVIPTAVAFVCLGNIISLALFQSGEFKEQDTLYVWATLSALSLGLLAATFSRLYSSAFYALSNTKTPVKIATIRVTFAAALGAAFCFYLPEFLNITPIWGIAGLALGSAAGAFLEFLLLKRALSIELGEINSEYKFLGLILFCAVLAAIFGVYLESLIINLSLHRLLSAVIILGGFGVVYLLLAAVLRIKQARNLLERFW